MISPEDTVPAHAGGEEANSSATPPPTPSSPSLLRNRRARNQSTSAQQSLDTNERQHLDTNEGKTLDANEGQGGKKRVAKDDEIDGGGRNIPHQQVNGLTLLWQAPSSASRSSKRRREAPTASSIAVNTSPSLISKYFQQPSTPTINDGVNTTQHELQSNPTYNPQNDFSHELNDNSCHEPRSNPSHDPIGNSNHNTHEPPNTSSLEQGHHQEALNPGLETRESLETLNNTNIQQEGVENEAENEGAQVSEEQSAEDHPAGPSAVTATPEMAVPRISPGSSTEFWSTGQRERNRLVQGTFASNTGNKISEAGEVKDKTTSDDGKRPTLNLDDDDDDDGNTCSICFDEWTTAGPHRVSSLKCGHLYGKSCIEKWLKGKGERCPQCNAKAKKADIRLIFAKKISAVDNTGTEDALKRLKEEQTERERAQQAEARARIDLEIAKSELRKVKEELKRAQLHHGGGVHRTLYKNTSLEEAGSAEPEEVPSGVNALQCELVQTIPIQQKEARIITYNPRQAWLLFSAASNTPTPFSPTGGNGLVKMSALNYADKQYVGIHNKTIRDIQICPDGSSMVLTVSLDKTAKLTNLHTNSVVQSYPLPSASWACCWKDQFTFHCGLTNHTILEFDTRCNREPVSQLSGPQGSKPIVSLHYLNTTDGAPINGILTGSLGGGGLWTRDPQAPENASSQSSMSHHLLPDLDGACTWVTRHAPTQTCLASYRPSRGVASVYHVVGKLVASEDPDQFSFHTTQRIKGPSFQRTLSRSYLTMHRDVPDHLFVCAGDEPSKKLKIWDVNSADVVHELDCKGSVCTDVMAFENENNTLVCALTEKHVLLHNWSTRS
eukprot:m.47214 g.47214  ORF g.47214 m.47214 type:complete len:837 (-) comp10465_c0_seq1:19-2529(-)